MIDPSIFSYQSRENIQNLKVIAMNIFGNLKDTIPLTLKLHIFDHLAEDVLYINDTISVISKGALSTPFHTSVNAGGDDSHMYIVQCRYMRIVIWLREI